MKENIMSMFRVVYYGQSISSPGEDQLFDVKFTDKNAAIEYAFQPNIFDNLSFMQEFSEDGTPIQTWNAQELNQEYLKASEEM